MCRGAEMQNLVNAFCPGRVTKACIRCPSHRVLSRISISIESLPQPDSPPTRNQRTIFAQTTFLFTRMLQAIPRFFKKFTQCASGSEPKPRLDQWGNVYSPYYVRPYPPSYYEVSKWEVALLAERRATISALPAAVPAALSVVPAALTAVPAALHAVPAALPTVTAALPAVTAALPASPPAASLSASIVMPQDNAWKSSVSEIQRARAAAPAAARVESSVPTAASSAATAVLLSAVATVATLAAGAPPLVVAARATRMAAARMQASRAATAAGAVEALTALLTSTAARAAAAVAAAARSQGKAPEQAPWISWQ